MVLHMLVAHGAESFAALVVFQVVVDQVFQAVEVPEVEEHHGAVEQFGDAFDAGEQLESAAARGLKQSVRGIPGIVEAQAQGVPDRHLGSRVGGVQSRTAQCS